MQWFDESLKKIQEGDIQTGAILLVGLLATFLLLKILMNSVKALIVIAAVIIIFVMVLPEVNLIEKIQAVGTDGFNLIKEQVGEKVTK
jgi:hypothetical protein